MTDKTLNTIIVLRNDKSTDWANSEVILKEGEVGVSYLDNGNVVVKAGNGIDKWPHLKQIEGVFEQPVTLTQNFGYYDDVPAGGFKTYDSTEGMTTSEFLLSALKKTVEPTIIQPFAGLTAKAVIENSDPEIGAKITGLTWTGTFDPGKYVIGTAEQPTNLKAEDTEWAVSNTKTAETTNVKGISTGTSTVASGSFDLTSDEYIQINTEGAEDYATINAEVTLLADNVATPKNNLGEDTTGTITAASAGAPWSESATVSVSGYRKPFWGVIAAAEGLKNPEDYVSADVRALPNKATVAKGFPKSLAVPAGSQMVVFFAKAGVYKSLTATDDKAMNAGVTFTKVANATRVKGAHDFVTADTGDEANGALYDLWYVDWKAGIGSAKQLTLKWS